MLPLILAALLGNPPSYADAYQRSIDENKALLIWVGGDFCPLCATEAGDEFVNCFVPSFTGAPNPSIVIGVPEDGAVYRIATLREKDWGNHGHVPAIKRTLASYSGAWKLQEVSVSHHTIDAAAARARAAVAMAQAMQSARRTVAVPATSVLPAAPRFIMQSRTTSANC